jgi:hypothetical protein
MRLSSTFPFFGVPLDIAAVNGFDITITQQAK